LAQGVVAQSVPFSSGSKPIVSSSDGLQDVDYSLLQNAKVHKRSI